MSRREEKVVFICGGLSVVCTGMLYGIHRQLSREKFKLDLRRDRATFLLATRALAYGTLLCFGSFIGITAIVVGVTGATSLKEFSEMSRNALNSKSKLDKIERERLMEQSYLSTKEMFLDHWNYYTNQSDDSS